MEYKLFNGDCLNLLKEIESKSIDAVVTDPPYQYLNTKEKNCEFDKPYDEKAYIQEVKRILKPKGFILMFGRGVAFYRQGALLADEGFKFKEEVVWNKRNLSNFTLPIGRQHENIFIFAKSKKGSIRKTKIPYIEHIKNISIKDAVSKIKTDIRTINNEIKKPEIFKDIMLFLEKDIENYVIKCQIGNNVTVRAGLKKAHGSIGCLKAITNGVKEKDIMNIPEIIEESIVRNVHHPTEKPVRLMERLIALVTDEGDVVLDSFMGSGTTGVACMNTNRRFIGMELDEKYFAIAKKRIEEEGNNNVKKGRKSIKN